MQEGRKTDKPLAFPLPVAPLTLDPSPTQPLTLRQYLFFT